MAIEEIISVIVPIYQVEAYLDRCVQSIIEQTYRNIEIILTDDGSPDNCPCMCDQWAALDSRIKVIHKENGGLSDARNVGMAAAKGTYIAFVDSDDWIDRNYLKWLYEGIQRTGADLAACDVHKVEDEDIISSNTDEPVITKHSRNEAMFDLTKGIRFRAVAWNKLYKRELLVNEAFPRNKLHEDEYFTYRIFDKCNSLAYVNLPLYNYFQREGSIMSGTSSHHLDIFEAYLARQTLFKLKYPDLYLNDKVLYCSTCINMYMKEYEEDETVKQRIKSFRRQVHFSLAELKNYNFKQFVYIIASLPGFIGLFSRLTKTIRTIQND